MWLIAAEGTDTHEREIVGQMVEQIEQETGYRITCIIVEPYGKFLDFRPYAREQAAAMVEMSDMDVVLVISQDGRMAVVTNGMSTTEEQQLSKVVQQHGHQYFKDGFFMEGLQVAVPALGRQFAGEWMAPRTAVPQFSFWVFWLCMFLTIAGGGYSWFVGYKKEQAEKSKVINKITGGL